MPELKHKVKEPTGYEYHLVVVADGILIDLSLPQANRPQYDIVLPSMWMKCGSCDENLTAVVNGCQVIYTFREDKTYKKLPDWTIKERWEEVVGEIIRELKARLEATSDTKAQTS